MYIYKKTTKSNGKTYTNLYVKLDNGKSIPIEVHKIVKDGKVLNTHDYAILVAIAQPYE